MSTATQNPNRENQEQQTKEESSSLWGWITALLVIFLLGTAVYYFWFKKPAPIKTEIAPAPVVDEGFTGKLIYDQDSMTVKVKKSVYAQNPKSIDEKIPDGYERILLPR